MQYFYEMEHQWWWRAACIYASYCELVVSATSYDAQHIIMYAIHILELISLKIKKLMHCLRWPTRMYWICQTTGVMLIGRTRHVDAHYYFLTRNNQKRRVIQVKWVSSEENCSDLFTRNLACSPLRNMAFVVKWWAHEVNWGWCHSRGGWCRSQTGLNITSDQWPVTSDRWSQHYCQIVIGTENTSDKWEDLLGDNLTI